MSRPDPKLQAQWDALLAADGLEPIDLAAEQHAEEEIIIRDAKDWHLIGNGDGLFEGSRMRKRHIKPI